MFTTPEGEPHELAVLAAAVSAKMFGVQAIFLGPASPPVELAQAAARLDADIVCIGSLVLPADKLGHQIELLSEALPRKTELWLGRPKPVDEVFSNHPRLRVFSDLFDYENAMRTKATLSQPDRIAIRIYNWQDCIHYLYTIEIARFFILSLPMKIIVRLSGQNTAQAGFESTDTRWNESAPFGSPKS